MEESTIIMDHGALARGQCESALETIERFQPLKRESGQGLVVRNGYHAQHRRLDSGALPAGGFDLRLRGSAAGDPG